MATKTNSLSSQPPQNRNTPIIKERGSKREREERERGGKKEEVEEKRKSRSANVSFQSCHYHQG